MNNDKVLSLTTANFLATHRILLFPNMLFFSCVLVESASHYFSIVLTLWFMMLIYWHIRLEFDVRIFVDFGNAKFSPDEFDTALVELKLQKRTNQRHISERTKSAMRVYKTFALLSVMMWLFTFLVFVLDIFGLEH